MKNEQVIVAWDKLNPNEAVKSRILNMIEEKQQQSISVKHPNLRPILRPVAVAVAAMLIIAVGMVINNTNLIQQENNFFTLKAYGLEYIDDGAAGTEESAIWHRSSGNRGIGRIDEDLGRISQLMELYWNGENIKSIEFSVGEGFFVYHISSESDEKLLEQGQAWQYGDATHLKIIPFEIFDRTGDSALLLDNDVLAKDVLLYWTLGWVDEDTPIPREIEITAEATFNDGKTEEQILSFDIAWMYTGVFIDMSDWRIQKEFYKNIDLDECELIPESVMSFDDYYEFTLIGTRGDQYTMRFDSMLCIDQFSNQPLPFDESGVFRFTWGDTYSGDRYNSGYVAVIVLEDDGSLTGMVYRTPMRPDRWR